MEEDEDEVKDDNEELGRKEMGRGNIAGCKHLFTQLVNRKQGVGQLSKHKNQVSGGLQVDTAAPH